MKTKITAEELKKSLNITKEARIESINTEKISSKDEMMLFLEKANYLPLR
ncbi:hypothetical protein Goe21_01990 [Bacillus phage vB_BsuM-Goe21]|nr:hypothetical protein Goe21_01990 [Bacillus phage vB_BsuM-Goe21]